MKRKMTSIILMVFVATLAFAGGSKEGKKAEVMNPTIVEIASNDERFSTLVTALGAADLVDTLNGEGPFTVFAPTNDAFAALPEGALEGLLADTAALTEVLLYHVASGRLMASDVVTLSEAETVSGKDRWVRQDTLTLGAIEVDSYHPVFGVRF